MHVVYFITFIDRKDNNIQPYYYIGSKSNCTFDGYNILDKKGKIYYGSSNRNDYQKIVRSEKIKVDILYETENYDDCLNQERNIQLQNDVVVDTRFFNASLALENNFHKPNYGTYRHIETGKKVRLEKNHPKVLDGTYININKGYKTYNNGTIQKQFLNETDVPEGWTKGVLEKNKLKGENNPFYGKKHTEKSKKKNREGQENFKKNNPELYDEMIEKRRKRTSLTFKGVPKSEESNRKRIRRNLIMLKNIHTGECVRVDKKFKDDYDSNVWKNPYAAKKHQMIKCPHCGKINEYNSSFKRWHFDKCKKRKIECE